MVNLGRQHMIPARSQRSDPTLPSSAFPNVVRPPVKALYTKKFTQCGLWNVKNASPTAHARWVVVGLGVSLTWHAGHSR